MVKEKLAPYRKINHRTMVEYFEKRERETIENDKKTYSSRCDKDWSGDKWKEGVTNHYKKMLKEFDKPPLNSLSVFNFSVDVEIIGPITTPYFRCYSILTPWVLDPVIEFMVDLDEKQKKTAKSFYLTRVESLTNEKSRWVSAGTSLVKDHPYPRLVKMGTKWANDMVYNGFRIIFAHTHL